MHTQKKKREKNTPREFSTNSQISCLTYMWKVKTDCDKIPQGGSTGVKMKMTQSSFRSNGSVRMQQWKCTHVAVDMYTCSNGNVHI